MNLKEAAAKEAIKLVKDHMVIGLGAGSTMAYLAGFLQQAVKEGLQVKVVSASFGTQQLLEAYGLHVPGISSVSKLDIYFDGCDQFDKHLHALKSGGGIHTMEKLLASMAGTFVLAGDDSKYVETFDAKYPLVIELLPESLAFVQQALKEVFPGANASVRMSTATDGAAITRHGNYLIDICFRAWPPLQGINTTLKNITGIIETSLFYNIASKAVIAGTDAVTTIDKPEPG